MNLALALALVLSLAPALVCAAADPATLARPAATSIRATEAHAPALSAARAWAGDAALVYAESTDSLYADGSARGWSFVFWSPTQRGARGFTVRIGGALDAFSFASPFDPPTLEDGWLDPVAILALAAKDPQARPRVRPASTMVLSRGLVTANAPPRGAWLLTEPDANAEWIFDALRGTGGRRSLTPPPSVSDDARGASDGTPPYLARFRTRFAARIETLRAAEQAAAAAGTSGSGAVRERARWLAAREAEALTRLSNQDAAWDTLGRASSQAAGASVAADLATLARWRERSAAADSTLADARARLAAAEKDLAATQPTRLAVFVSSEKRARPVRVSVIVDGVEVGRVSWSEAEWNALDAGGWAEVARATVRAGARSVRVEVEDSDRRIGTVTWSGTIAAQALQILRVRLPGPGEGTEPAISPLAYGNTRP
jgi:hypothetical protein